jgi:hypothetical protein
MTVTAPTTATFNNLKILVYGGPPPDGFDSANFEIVLNAQQLDLLDDSDIDAMVAILVNRISTDHPTYTVYSHREWTGSYNTAPTTEYEAP